MTFQLLHELSPDESAQLPALLALSIGHPTEERLKTTLQSYAAGTHRLLLIAKLDSQLVACVGLDVGRNEDTAILHLAVMSDFQKQGIGRALLDECVRRFSPKALVAETDGDAIGFYKSTGFKITAELVNEWQVKRYRIRRDL